MKQTTKWVIMGFLIFSVTIVSLTGISLRAESDDIDGTIDVAGSNNDVIVNTFELQNLSGTALVTDSAVIDPYESYRMHLELQDIDGLSDVTSITFKLFNLDRPASQMRDAFDSYTTTGIREIDGANYPNFIRSDDAFIVTWDGATDTFSMTGGSGSTWQLSEGAIQTGSNNTFTFEVDFRVAKVALNNNAWYIGALIEDGFNNDLTEETFVTNGNYGVNWFGELQVSQDAIIRWADVDAGTDFYGVGTTTTMITANSDPVTTESVTFKSNGFYQQRMSSSTTWSAVGDIPLNEINGNEAKLTTKSAQSTFSPQEFGLGVALNYDDVSVNTRLDTQPITIRGHQLDTENYNAQIWRARTREAGDEFSNIVFRVALADVFQNATYEGTLTIGISNETDILDAATALTQAESGLVTSGSVVGVYATSEQELIDLLSNSSIQVPIYLQNGFIELTTAPSITVANTALKPVIGDIFITGDDIQITNLTMLYGDLYIEGNQVFLTKTNIMSHSPGGDLYIKALNFTGANINVEGSVFVSNSASAILSQDTEIEAALSVYKIHENVSVSENSHLTIDNMQIGGGPSYLTDGDINVTGQSVIVFSQNVRFDTLTVTNSTGEINGTHFSGPGGQSGTTVRPIGNSMTLNASTVTQTSADIGVVTLNESSHFDKINGRADFIKLNDQSIIDLTDGEITQDVVLNDASLLRMLAGDIGDELRLFGSDAIISGGAIGFNLGSDSSGFVGNHGVTLDESGSHSNRPSTLQISGETDLLHLQVNQSAVVTMNGVSSEVDQITELNDSSVLTLNAGLLNYLRMFDQSNIALKTSNASIYKAHLFNTSSMTMQDGTIGDGNNDRSLVSVNDHAQFEMVGGTLNLGSFSDEKVDEQLIDNPTTNVKAPNMSLSASNSKRGLHIRDDAVVTLGSITIESSTELELRDNGQLTMTHDVDFNRMVKDYVSVFNEHDGEDSNLNPSGLQSLVEIYVEADSGGSATRPTRSAADNPSSIAFDYESIDGSGSAFEEARRLFDNFGHAVNVYVLDGTYNETATLQMDRDDFGLIYSPNGRADRRISRWGLTESPSSVAVVDKGIDITATSNVVQGVYFDLDNEAIHVSQSGLFSDVILRYNYVDQAGSTEPVMLVESKDFQVEGNYLTRPTDDANGSAALVLRGELQTSSIVDKNSINNISGHAVVFEQTGAASTANLSIDLNVIGHATRPVLGHAFYFSSGVFDQISFVSNDIQNISNTAILFGNITINEGVSHQLDQIWNINTGHAIHYTSDVVFGPTYVDITLIDVELNTGQLEGNGLFFDQISEVKNIELIHSAGSSYYFENMQSALRIEGATTISGIEVDSPNVQNIRGDAFYLQGTTIENISFVHNPSRTDGHRVAAAQTSDDTAEGIIQNISQNAIYLEGTNLDGFAMNGMIIDQFATAGDAYAGIDFNVQNISNLLINQALFRIDESTGGGGGTQFKEYRAIQTEFTNGLGPALRFHLDDGYTYTNNQLFNPDIENNAVGIEFAGSLSTSDPITKIFGSNANFSVNPNLSDLKTFVFEGGITLTSSSALVLNETASGLRANDVEIKDDTLRLDLVTFRSDFASLNLTPSGAQVFLIEDGTSQSFVGASVLDLDALRIESALDRVSLTTSGSLYVIETDYYVGDDGLTIVGQAADDLTAASGNLSLELGAPASASRATIYVETIGSGVTSQSALVSGSTVTFNVSVASLSGSSIFTSLPDGREYRVLIIWFDTNDAQLSASGVAIDTTQTTSAFITTLRSSTNEPITTFKGLLETSVTSQVDGSISETAFYTNLLSNLDANANVDTYAEFLTLFTEVNAYEVALHNALNIVNTTLTSQGALEPDVITNVAATLEGTLITESRDFSSTPVLASSTLSRLATIHTSLAAVSSEASVIDQLLASKPYADYFAILDQLETILNTFDVARLNGQNYDSLQAALDAGSASDEVLVLKNVSESVELSTPVSIDFNGKTLTGNITVAFINTATVTFTGSGILTGDLYVDAPNLTLNTNLTVQGETSINAIGSSSLNTSGVHTGGIIMNGPGRINALNTTIQPVITINTTAAIEVDGLVSEVSVSVDNAVLTINATLQKLTHNNRPVEISSSNGKASALPSLVQLASNQLLYDSITEAISEAAVGDTLYIGAGTFVEDLNIDKSVTLSGVNAGLSYDAARSAESYISGGSITFTTNDITLDGVYLLDTFVHEVDQNESGLSIINTILEHTTVLEEFENVSGSGDRYMIKAIGGISDVLLENLKIIGPGKDALATDTAISVLTQNGIAINNFFIGGIDFNSVLNSTISNIHIEDVSRYVIGLNTSGQNGVPTTSGILIEDLIVINSGHSESQFMAALAFFNQPLDVTLKGTFDFTNVPIGLDIRGTSLAQVTTSGFSLTVSNVGIDMFGLNVSGTAFSNDLLAQALGANLRWQPGVYENENQSLANLINEELNRTRFNDIAHYYLTNPHGDSYSENFQDESLPGLVITIEFVKTALP